MDRAFDASRAAEGNLRPATFLQRVAASIICAPPGALEGMQSHARSRLVKFWFGPDNSVHYEVSIHERAAQLEVGLHFEASPERNRSIYKELDRCILEIQSQLGSTVWLEEWDRGWARLYETQHLWPLDDARANEVAERLCDFIRVVQPVYEQILDKLGLAFQRSM